MRRMIGAALAVVVVAGCDDLREQDLPYDRLEARAYRAFSQSYAETPFANGAMSVIAAEAGRLRSWRLVPCATNVVCADSVHGRRGTVTASADFVIVDGLYGRRFWLSPGGSAVIERNGIEVIGAWNADANGIPDVNP